MTILPAILFGIQFHSTAAATVQTLSRGDAVFGPGELIT